MISKLTPHKQLLKLRLGALYCLGFAVILIENLTAAFWRVFFFTLGFAALWLLGIPAAIGMWLEITAFVVFASGVGYFLWADAPRFKWPRTHVIRRRIESESGVLHRPFSAIDDQPVTYAPFNALWKREEVRRKELLSQLKAPKPEAQLAGKDPYALRAVIVLLCVIGVFMAGPEWSHRLERGLFPFQNTGTAKSNAGATLWITPPEYTGQPRIVLGPGTPQPIQVPQGSQIKIFTDQSAGSFFFTPSLTLGGQKHNLEQSESGSYTFETELTDGGTIRFKNGLFSSIDWTYEYIADTPPTITITEQPEILSYGGLKFNITLEDDYSVKNLKMVMDLAPVVEDAPMGSAIEETRSVLSPPKTPFEMTPTYDLTAHTWAGLPVTFTFTAIDHLGQEAGSAPIEVILPERRFTHPIAKKLIEVRQYLAWNPEGDMRDSVTALEGLMRFPHQFNHDTKVFLALRSAASRLAYNKPEPENTMSVISLLWDTALRLEDGDLSLAARTLRDAQTALEDALNDPNASDEEIARLMQDLKEAMSEYMHAMARELQKQMAESGQMPSLPQEMMQNMMQSLDLGEMMERMQQELMSGDKDAARNMLSQLQRLLDMTGPSTMTELPPDMQMMAEGINELQELIEKQKALLAQTRDQAKIFDRLSGLGFFFEELDRRQSQNEGFIIERDSQTATPQQPRRTPFVNTADNATEQEALRYILGQLMLEADKALNEIPENFGLAEQAMRKSRDELQNNRPDRSIPHQDEAIKHLEESQEQLSQMMAQRMQQMVGLSFGGMPRRDPFGRSYGDNGTQDPNSEGRVKVPTEAQAKRVQEILDELKKRSSERDRPQEELEYYRRLLRRF